MIVKNEPAMIRNQTKITPFVRRPAVGFCVAKKAIALLPACHKTKGGASDARALMTEGTHKKILHDWSVATC